MGRSEEAGCGWKTIQERRAFDEGGRGEFRGMKSLNY